MNAYQSRLPSLAWPALVPPHAAELLALLQQLRESERAPAAAVEAAQFRQLTVLFRHAFECTAFYRERLSAVGYRPGEAVSADLMARLPILTRRDVQDGRDDLTASALPEGHGKATAVESSGSTGAPVRVLASSLTRLFWNVGIARSHEWNRRDLSALSAVINFFPKLPPVGARRADWGPPMSWIYRTGPCVGMHIATPVEQQARWLLAHKPRYLVTHPTNAMALAEWFIAHGETLPGLEEVCTMSESHPADLREACRQAWGARVADIYSSREAGIMAIECPHSGMYHAQSEHVRVEVLRDDGSACSPGETGRVVITNLHNFAFPLIRYDVGDFAQVGPPCGCGRTLPTLHHIAGRVRNMLVLPSGQRLWPSIGGLKVGRAAPIRQFQVIQESLTTVRLLLVADQPLSGEQERAVCDIVREALVHPFEIELDYRSEIPRTASGKFEEFKSLVAPAPPSR